MSIPFPCNEMTWAWLNQKWSPHNTLHWKHRVERMLLTFLIVLPLKKRLMFFCTANYRICRGIFSIFSVLIVIYNKFSAYVYFRHVPRPASFSASCCIEQTPPSTNSLSLSIYLSVQFHPRIYRRQCWRKLKVSEDLRSRTFRLPYLVALRCRQKMETVTKITPAHRASVRLVLVFYFPVFCKTSTQIN